MAPRGQYTTNDIELAQGQGQRLEQPFGIVLVQESAIEQPNLGRHHSLSADVLLSQHLVVG